MIVRRRRRSYTVRRRPDRMVEIPRKQQTVVQGNGRL